MTIETPPAPAQRSRFARLLHGALFIACAVLPTSGQTIAAPRERVSLNAGWRFNQGDPQWMSPQLDYASVRAWLLPSSAPLLGAGTARPARPSGNFGSDIAAVQPDFDDSAWRTLDLPHDWGIEGPFRQDLPGDTGKLPFASPGWYRKRFALPAEDAGRRLTLEVDGAMSCPLVWLNGQFVGGWAYGYTSFQLDLTPYAKPGADNVLVVRLDNLPESSRWYPGAGTTGARRSRRTVLKRSGLRRTPATVGPYPIADRPGPV